MPSVLPSTAFVALARDSQLLEDCRVYLYGRAQFIPVSETNRNTYNLEFITIIACFDLT